MTMEKNKKKKNEKDETHGKLLILMIYKYNKNASFGLAAMIWKNFVFKRAGGGGNKSYGIWFIKIMRYAKRNAVLNGRIESSIDYIDIVFYVDIYIHIYLFLFF